MRKTIKKIFRILVRVIILFNSFIYVYPQQNNLNFRHITSDDGLTSNYILSILQDYKGFMWIGTETGLNKFDGYDVRNYKHKMSDTNTIKGNRVQVIFEDKFNTLWVGTSMGLCVYNIDYDNFITPPFQNFPKELSSANINDIITDSIGNIWFSTLGQGVYRYNFNKSEYEHYQHTENDLTSLTNNFIEDLFIDSKSNIWLGTRYGLNRYIPDLNAFSHYLNDPENKSSLSSNHVFSMVENSRNFLCIGTKGGGLCRLNLNNLTSDEFIRNTNDQNNPNTIRNNEIQKIISDKYDNIWVGIENEGVVVFDSNFNILYNYENNSSDPQSLSNNSIYSMYRDKTNDIWIGTYSGGLNIIHYSKQVFKHYKNIPGDSKSLSYNTVTRFWEDAKGFVWIGTDGGGLNKLDTKTGLFTIYNTANSNLTSNAVLTVIEDSFGEILIGTWGGGLNILDKERKKIRSLSSKNSNLWNNNVRDIVIDENNNIWCVLFGGGLALFDKENNSFINYSEIIENYGDLDLNLIISDGKGNLIFGGFQGLHIYNIKNNKLTTYNGNLVGNNLSNNIIRALHYSDSILWIGTDEGLNQLNLNTNTFSYYYEEDGLPNNTINGIISDKNGLWISTNKGIAQFNQATNKFKLYSKSDGIQGNQFNWFSYYKTKNGLILFGGVNGFNSFDPGKLKGNPTIPSVVITEFKLSNKKVTPATPGSPLKEDISNTKKIILNYKQSFFSFSFTALNFVSSEKNEYAYKMEGLDQDWVNIGNQRTATYTNVNQGKYIFRVKASNNDGLWNNEGVSIEIIVLPPWWKTWWFRISVILLIVISLASFYIIRVSTLKARQIYLESKVDERTKELQFANFELKEQKEEIQQQSEEIMTQRDTLEDKNKLISESYKRIEMLSDFGQKLTSTLNIETINNLLYTYVSNLIDMHAFGIGLYSEATHQINFSNFIEEGKQVKPFSKDVDDTNSLTAYCFNRQEALYINDIEIEYSKYVQGVNETSTSQTAFSRIHIPLTVENKRIGIFIVNSYEKNAYTPDDFANLKTLASYISIALDNANAYKQINDINRSVEESINYAQSIQSAFLPPKETLDKYFENFVLFRPKDIVSGDFYWFSPIEKDPEKPIKAYIAVADCTGHGVPGALISIIGNNLLNEIVNIRKIKDPAQILEFLNVEFQLALKQDQSRNNDGMDIVLYYIEEVTDKKTERSAPANREYKVLFSGAKNSCIVFNKATDKVETIKGSRKSIGGLRAKRSLQFYEAESLKLRAGDILYLITDGYIDQMNMEKNRFTREAFIAMIGNCKKLNMAEQKKTFENQLSQHQQKEKQTDDITVLGIRL